jgi:hypothetical protein
MGEERAHIGVKHFVLDQVVDDIERELEIEATEIRRHPAAKIEPFRGVARKALMPRLPRVSCAGELRAVATTKFDDRLDTLATKSFKVSALNSARRLKEPAPEVPPCR